MEVSSGSYEGRKCGHYGVVLKLGGIRYRSLYDICLLHTEMYHNHIDVVEMMDDGLEPSISIYLHIYLHIYRYVDAYYHMVHTRPFIYYILQFHPSSLFKKLISIFVIFDILFL